jgi:hypothetical protein
MCGSGGGVHPVGTGTSGNVTGTVSPVSPPVTVPVSPLRSSPPSSPGGSEVAGSEVGGSEVGGAEVGGAAAAAAGRASTAEARRTPRTSRHMPVRVPPARGRILAAMGFNPYRKYRATATDYVLLAAVGLVAAGLVFWGLFS